MHKKHKRSQRSKGLEISVAKCTKRTPQPCLNEFNLFAFFIFSHKGVLKKCILQDSESSTKLLIPIIHGVLHELLQ